MAEPTQVSVPPLSTVAQVIALLQQFPQDLPVAIHACCNEYEPSRIAIVPADYGQQVLIS